MKKILIIAALCCATGLVQAQTTLRTDGTVINSSGATLGYLKTDGTVQDSHRHTLGYINNDGTIQDSHRAIIGYLTANGTIENSHHSTIGQAVGERKNEILLREFFFR